MDEDKSRSDWGKRRLWALQVGMGRPSHVGGELQIEVGFGMDAGRAGIWGELQVQADRGRAAGGIGDEGAQVERRIGGELQVGLRREHRLGPTSCWIWG